MIAIDHSRPRWPFPSFGEHLRPTGRYYKLAPMSCLLGVKPLFKTVSKIEASNKPPRIDLKSGQRYRNSMSVYRLGVICPSKTKK